MNGPYTIARGVLRGDDRGPQGPGRFEYVSMGGDDYGELPLDGAGDTRTRIRIKLVKNSRSIGWEISYEVVIPGVMGDEDRTDFFRDLQALGFGAIDGIPAMLARHAAMEEGMRAAALPATTGEGESDG